jgi:phage shock protein A
MGIFSRIKQGISSKANAAIDKAVDPAKEVELAILELEEGRKKALAELISYKATAKQMDHELEKQRARMAEWEKRAMMAVRAGDDEAAKLALREKKACEVELTKIARDKAEATGYAVQLNKSRKEFETKLQMLKLRKGTLATQLAAARSPTGDAFGGDGSVWDRFAAAEDRIDQEAIASEVDSAMRGEELAAHEFDGKLAAAARASGALPSGAAVGGPDDALAQLKAKMDEAKAAKQRALADPTASPAVATGAAGARGPKAGPEGGP